MPKPVSLWKSTISSSYTIIIIIISTYPEPTTRYIAQVGVSQRQYLNNIVETFFLFSNNHCGGNFFHSPFFAISYFNAPPSSGLISYVLCTREIRAKIKIRCHCTVRNVRTKYKVYVLFKQTLLRREIINEYREEYKTVFKKSTHTYNADSNSAECYILI